MFLCVGASLVRFRIAPNASPQTAPEVSLKDLGTTIMTASKAVTRENQCKRHQLPSGHGNTITTRQHSQRLTSTFRISGNHDSPYPPGTSLIRVWFWNLFFKFHYPCVRVCSSVHFWEDLYANTTPQLTGTTGAHGRGTVREGLHFEDSRTCPWIVSECCVASKTAIVSGGNAFPLFFF